MSRYLPWSEFIINKLYQSNLKDKHVSTFFHSELCSRELLDRYLSRALNVDLEDDQLTAINDSGYVLTLDYAIKMLNIHERSVSLQLEFV